MAKNWTAAEAIEVIRKGEDLAAIQDIGRRFPLFAVMANGGAEGLAEIVKALPSNLTVRKIESQLKADIDDEVEGDEEEAAKEEKKSKKDKKGKKNGKKGKAEKEEKKGKKGKKGKKKEEVEEEEEDLDDEEMDEEDDEDDGLEDMSLAQLRKYARKNKVDIEGLKSKEDIIAAIRGEDADDEDDEDDDDDWDV